MGLYEPIHGSAPTIAGRGIVNPIGTVLSAAMLLRHSLGLEHEAGAIEAAVHSVLASGDGTPDIVSSWGKRISTIEVAEAIVEQLES